MAKFTTGEEYGAAERTRTSDFFLRREALYPLSYSRVWLVEITPKQKQGDLGVLRSPCEKQRPVSLPERRVSD
jgi:hypothetical protein